MTSSRHGAAYRTQSRSTRTASLRQARNSTTPRSIPALTLMHACVSTSQGAVMAPGCNFDSTTTYVDLV